MQTYSESPVTQGLAIYHSRHPTNGIEIRRDYHALPWPPGSRAHHARADSAYILRERSLSMLWMLGAVQLHRDNLRGSLGAPASPRSHLSLPQIEEKYFSDRLMNVVATLGSRALGAFSSQAVPFAISNQSRRIRQTLRFTRLPLPFVHGLIGGNQQVVQRRLPIEPRDSHA